MSSASAWAPLLSDAALALVLPTVRIPLTSAATADEVPAGAGVVVVTVLVVPEVVAIAATPMGTETSGVSARTTVARRTALRTMRLLDFYAVRGKRCGPLTPSNQDQTDCKPSFRRKPGRFGPNGVIRPADLPFALFND